MASVIASWHPPHHGHDPRDYGRQYVSLFQYLVRSNVRGGYVSE